jgi:hypothetical protein
VAAVFDIFPLGLPAWYPGSEAPLGILIEAKSRKFYAIGITRVFSESLLPRGNPGHRELDVRLVEAHLDKPKAAVSR